MIDYLQYWLITKLEMYATSNNSKDATSHHTWPCFNFSILDIKSLLCNINYIFLEDA